jgi:2-hydroxycyclohexanecarboxyl-CoA dehydrogenase
MTQRTALVTGAAAGIGRACAERLAREGKRVGVLDLDKARCEDTVNAILAEGGEAIALAADISDRAQVGAALDELRAAFGPITIVVNNAGIANFIAFEDLTDDDWDIMFKVNCRGMFVVTQLVLPDMKAAQWGRIINISSSSAQAGSPRQVHYSASKGAVVSMTRSLSQAVGQYGITVNNIPPGSVLDTIMSQQVLEGAGRYTLDQLTAMIPMGRTGVSSDIANACSWLASEDSSYVTGQTISVNGGRVVT